MLRPKVTAPYDARLEYLFMMSACGLPNVLRLSVKGTFKYTESIAIPRTFAAITIIPGRIALSISLSRVFEIIFTVLDI